VIVAVTELPLYGRYINTERMKSLDRLSIARANTMRFLIKLEERVRYADVIGTVALLLTIIGLFV